MTSEAGLMGRQAEEQMWQANLEYLCWNVERH